MRTIQRTLSRSQLRDVALVTAAGMPPWLAPLLAVVVLAGSAEFLFVGILGAGGGVVAAVLAALLVNARHVPYGMASRDLVGRGWRRFLGAHVLNDESVALGLAQPTPEQRRATYWLTGFGVLVFWPLGAVVGVLLAGSVPDPDAIGLDAMFPAIMAALVVPALRAGTGRRAALVGAVVALVGTPFLPAGLPPLLALLGLLAHRRSARA